MESPYKLLARSNGRIENYNCCRKHGLLCFLRQNPNLTLLGSYHKAEPYHWIIFIAFPIVLVPRYKLSLCHTPIKTDLLGFPGIGVFACRLHDYVMTRFASFGNRAWLH